jgi:hypothetical protein
MNKEKVICKECNLICKSFKGLQIHIRKKHNADYKKYFDKWLKNDQDGKCKICSNNTDFLNFAYGYKNCCSEKCSHLYIYKKTKESNLKKYGVECLFSLNTVKDKIKKTNLKKYGNSNINKVKSIREKIENTCLKKYGVKHNFLRKEFDKERKKTCLKNLGCEYPSQSYKIFEKIQKSGLKYNLFKNTDLYYQGSYELDFLEKYYDKYPDIQRGPTLKYIYNNKIHYYHSDFYIPSLNLIIECKNKFLEKRDKKIIEEKENSVIKNGYKFMIIIEKDYTNINKFLKENYEANKTFL